MIKRVKYLFLEKSQGFNVFCGISVHWDEMSVNSCLQHGLNLPELHHFSARENGK